MHRLGVTVEDAGFDVRDTIAWLYWTGFPKSVDAEREVARLAGRSDDSTIDPSRWVGFGTAVKPTHEPALLARKPMPGTLAANLVEWGTGVLNVEACRVEAGDPAWPGPDSSFVGARFPANVYHCPKPSRAEKEHGCDTLPERSGAQAVERRDGSAGLRSPRAGAGRTAATVRNWHPTVKPVRLMRWLCRLVGGLPGSVIVDTFAGSGTTLVAAHVEGFRCIGIEREPRFCDIARARLERATKETP